MWDLGEEIGLITHIPSKVCGHDVNGTGSLTTYYLYELND